MYITAPALAGFARYNVVESLQDKTPAEVQPLDWTTKWETTGLLSYEDKSKDSRLQFTLDEATNEIIVDRDIIVLSTPHEAQILN